MANAKVASPILNFDATSIATIGFLFKGEETAIASDCNGTLGVETETQTIQKKCGATVVKSITKPTQVTVTISAQVPVEVFRRVQGIKPMEELKAGVYAYGGSSKGEKFALTAELVDDFEDTTKLLAFPEIALSTGLTFEIENGVEETANFEMEAIAYQDDMGNWYYEAYPEEATEVDKVEWLTKFTEKTVKKSATK